MDRTLKIGEVARRAGQSVESIRYYERLGLIREAPRTPSGYRRFSPEVVGRLRFIQKAQGLGFPLRTIRELLDLRSAPGASAAQVRQLAEARLEEVEEKLADLTRLRDELKRVTSSCAGTGAVSECAILRALEDPGAAVSPEPVDPEARFRG